MEQMNVYENHVLASANERFRSSLIFAYEEPMTGSHLGQRGKLPGIGEHV